MIIINGASRGIGKYLFERYTKNGEKVFGTFNKTTPSAFTDHYFQVDVRHIDSIKNFISEISSFLENITLINCSGINYNAVGHKVNFEEWSRVIDVNLVGTFRFISTILPYMREQNFGRIINFSSVVAQKGVAGTSAYASSKSGLLGLTKSLSSENANKGITINNLNLGYFNIGMISEVPNNFQDIILQQIPTHKFGDPNEIFNACEFLRNNGYINGSSIDISAGLV